MLSKVEVNYDMDTEWMELIFEARKLGFTIEEVQEFLQQNARKEISNKKT